MNERQRTLVDAVTRQLTDEGKLIEAGWQSMRILVLPPDAPLVQVTEMRKAFFAGAQHLYASMMTVMDAGEEPTDQDMRRMGLIDQELRSFAHELARDLRGQRDH